MHLQGMGEAKTEKYQMKKWVKMSLRALLRTGSMVLERSMMVYLIKDFLKLV